MKELVFLSLVTILIITSCVGQEKNAQEMFDKGSSFFEKGNFDAAIEKYQEGLQLEPNNYVGYNLLGMAYRFKFNQTGTQEFKSKEIQSFKKAIELEPKYWVAYKNIAASLYYQNRKKEAVPYLEKALELQPNDPEKSLLLQWIEEGKE
jgi:superkiller protein 3